MVSTTFTRRTAIERIDFSTDNKKEFIVELLKEMKAEKIVLLKVEKLTTIADYFIICSVDNSTQLQMTVSRLEKDLRDHGIKPLYPIKEKSPSWTIADFGDIIVHIFMPEERKLYALEEFWEKAPITHINY
ncbi:MAG: ribosome silencing factor [Caldisericia bacterium]|nr:ribosome silencing factor [Caldisericia bacterium]